MKRQLFLLATVCVVLTAALPCAQAAPSFRGYTGLVVIPTADSLNKSDWNAGIMTEAVDDFDANDIFVNYGIVDNLEVGFNAFQRLGSGGGKSSRQTLINAKYRFQPETEYRPGIAFGVADLTNGVDTSPYAVASKSFAKGLRVFDAEILNLRGHIGLGGGQFDGLFLGLSSTIGNRFTLSFEWDSEDPNLGVRIAPFRGFRLHAAWFDMGGRDDVGLGASFNMFY